MEEEQSLYHLYLQGFTKKYALKANRFYPLYTVPLQPGYATASKRLDESKKL